MRQCILQYYVRYSIHVLQVVNASRAMLSGRSTWARRIYGLLHQRSEAALVVSVVKSAKPVGMTSVRRDARRSQVGAYIEHEDVAL